MAANVNNNKAMEVAEAQDKLVKLKELPNASKEEIQKQEQKIQELIASRGGNGRIENLENSQEPQNDIGDSDLNEAQGYLDSAATAMQGSGIKAPIQHIVEEEEAIGHAEKALAAVKNFRSKSSGKSELESIAESIVGRAAELIATLNALISIWFKSNEKDKERDAKQAEITFPK